MQYAAFLVFHYSSFAAAAVLYLSTQQQQAERVKAELEEKL
jgi:hypothetical protein